MYIKTPKLHFGKKFPITELKIVLRAPLTLKTNYFTSAA